MRAGLPESRCENDSSPLVDTVSPSSGFDVRFRVEFSFIPEENAFRSLDGMVTREPGWD